MATDIAALEALPARLGEVRDQHRSVCAAGKTSVITMRTLVLLTLYAGGTSPAGAATDLL